MEDLYERIETELEVSTEKYQANKDRLELRSRFKTRDAFFIVFNFDKFLQCRLNRYDPFCLVTTFNRLMTDTYDRYLTIDSKTGELLYDNDICIRLTDQVVEDLRQNGIIVEPYRVTVSCCGWFRDQEYKLTLPSRLNNDKKDNNDKPLFVIDTMQ